MHLCRHKYLGYSSTASSKNPNQKNESHYLKLQNHWKVISKPIRNFENGSRYGIDYKNDYIPDPQILFAFMNPPSSGKFIQDFKTYKQSFNQKKNLKKNSKQSTLSGILSPFQDSLKSQKKYNFKTKLLSKRSDNLIDFQSVPSCRQKKIILKNVKHSQVKDEFCQLGSIKSENNKKRVAVNALVKKKPKNTKVNEVNLQTNLKNLQLFFTSFLNGDACHLKSFYKFTKKEKLIFKKVIAKKKYVGFNRFLKLVVEKSKTDKSFNLQSTKRKEEKKKYVFRVFFKEILKNFSQKNSKFFETPELTFYKHYFGALVPLARELKDFHEYYLPNFNNKTGISKTLNKEYLFKLNRSKIFMDIFNRVLIDIFCYNIPLYIEENMNLNKVQKISANIIEEIKKPNATPDFWIKRSFF